MATLMLIASAVVAVFTDVKGTGWPAVGLYALKWLVEAGRI